MTFSSAPRHARHLVRAAIGLLALSLGLAACAASPTASPGAAGAAAPTTVRVSVLGSASDTLDITKAATFLPYAVALNLYDSLAIQREGAAELQLAESIEPNDDGSVWTIRVRPGVTFHDGQPLTAADVLYSLRYLSSAPVYGSMYADLDMASATTDGDLTVILPLHRPRADLIESVLAQNSVIFPDGTTDFAAPVGSGPFRFESFSGDTGAVLVRNDDYWGGASAIERLEFLPIADATARLAALLDGQVDFSMGITATGAETIDAGSGVVVQNAGTGESSAFSFTMNTRKAPFDDPEVREAFRLVLDREQLTSVVLRGSGEVGNDLVGKGLAGYNTSLPQRERDLAKARAVFEAKGVTTLDLLASEMAPGITDSARLLVQQLAEAGVTATVSETDPATLWSDLSVLEGTQVFASYAINRPFAAHAAMFTGAGSPGNYGGWVDEVYDDLLARSQSTVEPTQRAELLDQLQARFWEVGPDAVWGYQPVLAAHVQGLEGVRVSQSVPLFHTAAYAG